MFIFVLTYSIAVIAVAILLYFLMEIVKKEAKPVTYNGKKVMRSYSWRLDSPRGGYLRGKLEIEFDEDAIEELRLNNPFRNSDSWDDSEFINRMYRYLRRHPQHLEACKKIVKYINQLCSQRNIREIDKLQFVLDFVQEPNIKYRIDDKCEEIDNAEEYFRYPDETLFDKRGDCDCKAFLAAMLYHIMGYNVLYITSNKLGHAAICIQFDPAWEKGLDHKSRVNFGRATITVNEKLYIYCETTSDGWRIGGINRKESVKDFDTIIELKA